MDRKGGPRQSSHDSLTEPEPVADSVTGEGKEVEVDVCRFNFWCEKLLCHLEEEFFINTTRLI